MDAALAQSARDLRVMVMRHPVSLVTRVVVGVDGSAGAAAAVQWAAAEACRHQVVLRIVSAWDEPGEPGPFPAHDPARIAAAQVQKALARVLERPHRPRRIACATLRGNPGEALLNVTGEGGLLVLGLAGIDGVPSGRVNEYCLGRGLGPLVFVSAALSVMP